MAVANPYPLSLDSVWPNVLHYRDVFLRAKWSILGWTLTFALVGLGSAATTTNVYEATVVARFANLNGRGVVAGSPSRSLLRQLGNQLGNSVFLDNHPLGGPAHLEGRQAFAMLKSRDFLTHFVEKHGERRQSRRERRQLRRKPSNLDPDASDPDASDPDEARDIPVFQSTVAKLRKTYREFREGLSTKVEELTRKLYRPYAFDWEVRRDSTPDLESGHGRLKRAIKIARRPRQGLIDFKVRLKDPVLAAEWANALIAELNSALREEAITEARKRIAYLNRELEKTSVIPLRQSIYRLIEGEIHTIMVAETRVDYMFKVIEHAVPPGPDAPIRPRRSRMIWTTALMGFGIGAFWAVWRDSIRMLRGLGEGSRAAR